MSGELGDGVRQWYEQRQNVAEMAGWKRLKIWEQAVAKRFPAGGRVLDVGCGMGREAFALADLGFAVTGLDISAEAIRQMRALAAEQGYALPFFHYEGRVLPFEADSFDVVVIWAQTFGLLYGEDAKRAFLGECKRVLRPGGWVSYSGHDRDYVKANYERFTQGNRFFPYANTALYWELFSPEELATYAEAAGLHPVLCERGEVYTAADGTILHCLCQKPSV